MDNHSDDEPSLAFQLTKPGTGAYGPTDRTVEQRLEVFVIFTSIPGTEAAMLMAGGLAKGLNAHLRLVMPYAVPYALPLTKPPVPVAFLEAQLRALASQFPTETAADIYLCRDQRRTLRLVLKPHSLVVVGGRRCWWPTPEQRLTRALTRDEHHVVFAELR